MLTIPASMTTSENLSNGRLEVLTEISDPDPNVDLVLIPGVGTTPVSEWGICQAPWLSKLQQNQTRLRLVAFHYQVAIDEQFSWQVFLDQGANLLRELSHLRKDIGLHQRPLLLVSHSLGGCVLKQALSIANFQHPRYDLLLNLIIGIVFLGTPHSSPRDEAFAERCLWILRAAHSGIPNKQLVGQKKGDISLLTNLAARFKDLNTGLDVLSVYELKKTNISRTFTTKRIVLVDKELAEIVTLRERCIGLPLTHLDLCACNDESEEPDDRVLTWFQTVLKYSSSNIEDRMRSYRSRTPSDPISDVGVSLEAANYALSRSQDASAQAGNTGDGQYGSSTFDVEIIPMVEAFTPARRQAVLPCRSLGGYPRNEDFTGRVDELNRLDQVLLPREDRVVSSETAVPKHVTLCGTPGLGKTELALEFAHSRQHHFDAVFWLHADTPGKLELDFADIAVKLGLEDAKEPRDLVISRETTKGWLSKPTKLLDQKHDTVGQTEASWLIVLDNADDPDIVSDYAHIFGTGSWLITSRHPLAKTAFSRDTTALDLEALDDQTGARLLQRLTDAHDGEDLSRAVSHRLGGHPLSITQMAGYIRREYLPLKDFLEMYHDETVSPTASLNSLSLLDTEKERRVDRARGTMASIWAVEALKTTSRSLLEAMIFLDPDCIQDYLMRDACAQVISDTHFPKRLKAFFAARAALMDSSLLKKVNEDTCVRIHRVLQDTVRVKLTRSQDIVFADTVAVLCEAWPSADAHKVHDVERWPRCKELYPHVIYLRSGYKSRYLEHKHSSSLQYARLLYEAGW